MLRRHRPALFRLRAPTQLTGPLHQNTHREHKRHLAPHGPCTPTLHLVQARGLLQLPQCLLHAPPPALLLDHPLGPQRHRGREKGNRRRRRLPGRGPAPRRWAVSTRPTTDRQNCAARLRLPARSAPPAHAQTAPPAPSLPTRASAPLSLWGARGAPCAQAATRRAPPLCAPANSRPSRRAPPRPTPALAYAPAALKAMGRAPAQAHTRATISRRNCGLVRNRSGPHAAAGR